MMMHSLGCLCLLSHTIKLTLSLPNIPIPHSPYFFFQMLNTSSVADVSVSAPSSAPSTLKGGLLSSQEELFTTMAAKIEETQRSYKEAKAKNKEQARKARQLLAAVAAKLQEKEDEMMEVRRACT